MPQTALIKKLGLKPGQRGLILRPTAKLGR